MTSSEWWTELEGNPSIPDGYVLPVQHVLQGHPEAPPPVGTTHSSHPNRGVKVPLDYTREMSIQSHRLRYDATATTPLPGR